MKNCKYISKLRLWVEFYNEFLIISPYIIYNYLWLFSIFLVIFVYFTLGYFWLF
jgi:hypothetical protein